MVFFYFIAYQILYLLKFPLIVFSLLQRKSQRKLFLSSVFHRLGFVPCPPREKKVIWIQGGLVKEPLALQSLINELKTDPHTFVYVTAGTENAFKIAQTELSADVTSFMTYDFLASTLIALSRIKPSTLIVIEPEISPNLLIMARFFKIPLYSLNATLSSYAKRQFFIFKGFYKTIFGLFDHVYAQTPDDKKLFVNLGINQEKVSILGNMQAFNLVQRLAQKTVPSATAFSFFKKNSQPRKDSKPSTLLAGHLHPQEIDRYLSLYKALHEKGHRVKLVLVPQYSYWQEALERKVKALEDSFAIWDEKSIRIQRKPDDMPKYETIIHQREIKNSAPVILSLLDTANIVVVCVREKLDGAYQWSDISFLGGTIATDSYTLLEACGWKKLSIIGPHEKCAGLANTLEKHHALIKVKDEQELFTCVDTLLNQPESLKLMGNNAYEWLFHEAKGVEKSFDHLLQTMSYKSK